MLSLLQRAEIRRLFYAEHWPIGTIADALGVHHETVSRALNRARGIHPGPQIGPSELDPYKAFIATTLEQYPRLRATRLHAMPRERGYPGSAVQVRRYVRTVRPAARAEAFFRLDTLVGEQGQVDCGVSSGKTPYLRFDSNDYSIPSTLIRRPLTLVISEHQVRTLDGTTEVACHARTHV